MDTRRDSSPGRISGHSSRNSSGPGNESRGHSPENVQFVGPQRMADNLVGPERPPLSDNEDKLRSPSPEGNDPLDVYIWLIKKLPLSMSKKMLADVIKGDKETPDENFLRAAQKLHGVLARQSTLSEENALLLMLEKVEQSDHLTQEDLLDHITKCDRVARKESLALTPPSQLPFVDDATQHKTAFDHLVCDPEVSENATTHGIHDAKTPDARRQTFVDKEDKSIEQNAQEKISAMAAALANQANENPYDTVGKVFGHRMIQTQLDLLVDFVVGKLQEQWRNILYVVFPLHHIQTLLLICIVQAFSVPQMLSLVPVFLSYFAFACMVYFTLKMFRDKHVMHDVETWQRLLNVFSEDDERKAITPSHLHGLYSWHSSEPYIYFFVSLAGFIFTYAMAGPERTPNGLLLCVLACVMSVFTMATLSDMVDQYAMAALLANLASSLHAFAVRLNLPVAQFSLLVKPIFCFKIGLVVVSVGVPTFCILLVPVIYAGIVVKCVKMKCNPWKVIVPQLVCLMWSEVAIMVLLKGDLSIQPLTVALTVSAILLTFWPNTGALVLTLAFAVAQLRHTVTFAGFCKAALTLGLILVPFLYKRIAGFLKKKRGWKLDGIFSNRNKSSGYLILLFYILLVLAAITMLYHGRLGFSWEKHVTNVTWKEFETTCGPGKRSNALRQQYACLELKDTAVQWKGTVQVVRLVKIDNSYEVLLDYLPDSFADWLKCFYGHTKTGLDWWNEDDRNRQRAKGAGEKGNPEPGTESETQISKNSAKDANIDEHCSLTHKNVYTFEIEVFGPYGQHMISSNKGTIILRAGHPFKNMLELLDEGDVVTFVAFFEEYPIYRYPPKLRLLSLECNRCAAWQNQNSDAVPAKIGNDGILIESVPRKLVVNQLYGGYVWSHMFYSFKFFFNFLFAPLFHIPT